LENLKAQNIEELVICGMMSHMCVDTTTREAFDLGFKCTVIHDACATRTLKFNNTEVPAAHVHASAMAALQFAFAKVFSSEEFFNQNQ
jgi:nicotinamidase-related amidase